jgi:CO/xanthine dehydrogenase FAD-binding subunit
MHADLSGEAIKPEGDARFHAFHPGSLEFIETVTVPCKPIEERRIDLEDSASLPQSMMEIEANRCLNCGCVAVSPSDTGAALIALDAVIVTTQREIPAEAFFACRECSSTVLEVGELVKEIRIPTPADGSRSTYRKFRMRESIDFPIVSAAVRVDVSAGAITESRVVLGAVAPIPLRASTTESYLQGRKVSEVTGELPAGNGKLEWHDLPAAQAAGLAVEGAVELKENAYKIQLTRAYVRRAILACLEE